MAREVSERERETDRVKQYKFRAQDKWRLVVHITQLVNCWEIQFVVKRKLVVSNNNFNNDNKCSQLVTHTA